MTREEAIITLFCVCVSLGLIIYLIYEITCIGDKLSDALEEIRKLGKEHRTMEDEDETN